MTKFLATVNARKNIRLSQPVYIYIYIELRKSYWSYYFFPIGFVTFSCYYYYYFFFSIFGLWSISPRVFLHMAPNRLRLLRSFFASIRPQVIKSQRTRVLFPEKLLERRKIHDNFPFRKYAVDIQHGKTRWWQNFYLYLLWNLTYSWHTLNIPLQFDRAFEKHWSSDHDHLNSVTLNF